MSSVQTDAATPAVSVKAATIVAKKGWAGSLKPLSQIQIRLLRELLLAVTRMSGIVKNRSCAGNRAGKLGQLIVFIICYVNRLLSTTAVCCCPLLGEEMIEHLERPEGTVFVNQRNMPDGTKKINEIEYPDGAIEFGVTVFPDRVRKIERVEFADKTVFFDVIERQDKTLFIGTANFADGFVWRNVSGNFDGNVRADIVETDGKIIYINGTSSDAIWCWTWSVDRGRLKRRWTSDVNPGAARV
jgi:hypothetical protein